MENKESDSSKRPLLAPPAKAERKRKSASEKAETKRKCDKLRAQSRVNIGSSFDRWRKLRQDLGLKSDADTAEFLLNSYEKSPISSTPMKTGFQGPPAPAASTIFSESDSDRGKCPSLLFNFMKLGMVDRSSFYRIQDAYCVDTVKDFWNEKRAAIIAQLQSKGPVVVLGDARMDSPGFSAQYCTYTTMDNDSKQIVSMVNIDKRQTMRNSVAMEKEGFTQTLETLGKEVNIVEFCTDAHMLISALFNTGKYKDSGIRHTLDMWHGSKSLAKKIHTAGQHKGCKELLDWTRDICNHFWHCCKSADTYDEFFELWSGVLHHVTGEHEWALGACQHGPLPQDRNKAWMKKGSEAHVRLSEIILDARWLKNVHKYLSFRSTAELESFHNHILMYASKRFSFTPPVYAARTMLAGLDYNHHINRPPKKRPDGSQQYGKVFNKKSRKWSLYTIKEDKDYAYVKDLQSAILERRLSTSSVPRQSKERPDDPRQHGVLSGVPAPTTEELLETQVSRGLGQSL